VWKDSQVPELSLVVSNLEFLEFQHLHLTVYDSDGMTQDEIGQTTLPLSLGFGEKPGEFASEISRYGMFTGIVKGSILPRIRCIGNCRFCRNTRVPRTSRSLGLQYCDRAFHTTYNNIIQVYINHFLCR
jgi:hypothetical protein